MLRSAGLGFRRTYTMHAAGCMHILVATPAAPWHDSIFSPTAQHGRSTASGDSHFI